MFFDSNELRDLRSHLEFVRDQYQRHLDTLDKVFDEHEETIDCLKLCLLREAQRAEANLDKEIEEPEFTNGKLIQSSDSAPQLIQPCEPDPRFGIWVYGPDRSLKRKQ
jgi:hypothetical protein